MVQLQYLCQLLSLNPLIIREELQQWLESNATKYDFVLIP